jgi:hypothetical protein
MECKRPCGHYTARPFWPTVLPGFRRRRDKLSGIRSFLALREAKVIGGRLTKTAIRHDLVLLAIADLQSLPVQRRPYGQRRRCRRCRLNKAETLGRIKPLHCTHCHFVVSEPPRIEKELSHRRRNGKCELHDKSSRLGDNRPVYEANDREKVLSLSGGRPGPVRR